MSSSSSITRLIDHCDTEPIENISPSETNIILSPKRRKLNNCWRSNDNNFPETTGSQIINSTQKRNEVTISVHSPSSYLLNQDNSLNTLSYLASRSTPMGANCNDLQRIVNLSQNPLLPNIQMLQNTTGGGIFQQPILPNTQGIHISVTSPATTIIPWMNLNPGINSSLLGQNLNILPSEMSSNNLAIGSLRPDQFQLSYAKMQILNDLQQAKYTEQLIFQQALTGPRITIPPFINHLDIIEQRIVQEGGQSQQLPTIYESEKLLAKSKPSSLFFSSEQNNTTKNESKYTTKAPTIVNLQNLYAQDENSEGSSKYKRKLLYLKYDNNNLSKYQCLVRKQIEIFEAKKEDVAWRKEAYGKEIVLGQIGIQCRHCARIPTRHRTRGATYYLAGLKGLYQAAQNMAGIHLAKHCYLIPDDERKKISFLRKNKSSCYGGGKQYWIDGVSILGIIEVNGILRFKEDADEKPSSGIKNLSNTVLDKEAETNTEISSSTRTEKNFASSE